MLLRYEFLFFIFSDFDDRITSYFTALGEKRKRNIHTLMT